MAPIVGYACHMTNTEHTIDQASADFSEGMGDGYHGYTAYEFGSVDYFAGYAAGQAQWAEDSEADYHANDMAWAEAEAEVIMAQYDEPDFY